MLLVILVFSPILIYSLYRLFFSKILLIGPTSHILLLLCPQILHFIFLSGISLDYKSSDFLLFVFFYNFVFVFTSISLFISRIPLLIVNTLTWSHRRISSYTLSSSSGYIFVLFCLLFLSPLIFNYLSAWQFNPLLARSNLTLIIRFSWSLTQCFLPLLFSYFFKFHPNTIRFYVIAFTTALFSLYTIFLGSSSGIIAYILSILAYINVFSGKPGFLITPLAVQLKKFFSSFLKLRFSRSSFSAYIKIAILLFIFPLLYVSSRIFRGAESELFSFQPLSLLRYLLTRYDGLSNPLSLAINTNLLDICPREILATRPFHILQYFIPRSLLPEKLLPFNALMSLEHLNVPIYNGKPIVTVDFGGYFSSFCEFGSAFSLILMVPMVAFVFYQLSLVELQLTKQDLFSQNQNFMYVFILLNFSYIPASLIGTQTGSVLASSFFSILPKLIILHLLSKYAYFDRPFNSN